MAENYVRFQRGTLANYKALATKQADTLYFVYNEDSDTTALYLGGRLIAGTGEIIGANNLDELNDVLISAVANKDILQYDGTQWKNITFANLIEQIKEQLDITIDTSLLATKEELNKVSTDLAKEVSDANSRIDNLDFISDNELNAALETKADKATTLKAYGIDDAYTKEETLAKISEKIKEVNGGETAGEVLAELTSYIEVNNSRVSDIESRLNGLEVEDKNIINSVEEAEFNLVDKHLSLKAINVSKLDGLENHRVITDLTDMLNSKVDALTHQNQINAIESEIATMKDILTWKDV